MGIESIFKWNSSNY